DGAMELQRWRRGELVTTRPLEAVDECELVIEDEPWMFEADSCINGLAHGTGLAASLDGERIVVEGRFVLGHLVSGEIQELRPRDT
ncbi:MAG: hypothetical protein ACODAC_03950, partial [Pseudomonadota bacterium]